MSRDMKLSEQEKVSYVFITLALVFLLFSLGPVVLCIAAFLIVVLSFSGIEALASVGLAAFAAITGMILHQDWLLWLMMPVAATHGFYAASMPDGVFYMLLGDGTFTAFLSSLGAQSLDWLSMPHLWLDFMPAGVFWGGHWPMRA